jgi:MYXO-CTERM domain-containing protein
MQRLVVAVGATRCARATALDPTRPACAVTGPGAGQCVACTLTMTSTCPMERPVCVTLTALLRGLCVPAMGMMMSFCAECAQDMHCAGRRDGRDRCIGANNTCAQCNDSDRGVCTATGVGTQCVNGLCGCSLDDHCIAGRRCNLSRSRCEEVPDAGTPVDVVVLMDVRAPEDNGVREDVQDATAPADVSVPMDATPTSRAYVGGGCGCRVGTAKAFRSERFLGMLGLAVMFGTRRRRCRRSIVLSLPSSQRDCVDPPTPNRLDTNRISKDKGTDKFQRREGCAS